MRPSPLPLLVLLLPALAQAEAPTPRLVALHESGGCVVRSDDEVRCFGAFAWTGDDETAVAPVPILGTPRDIVDLVVDPDLGCVLTGSGEIHCWGNRFMFEWLEESERRSERCAAMDDAAASARCREELDRWEAVRSRTARRVATGAADFAATEFDLCIVDREGRVRCAGFAPGTEGEEPFVPVRWNRRIGRAVAVDIGLTEACAVVASGALYCWGELAPGVTERAGGGSVLVPRRVPRVTDAVDVQIGVGEICVLRRDRTVMCVALDPSAAAPDEPRGAHVLESLVDVEELAVRDTVACARTRRGETACWGMNEAGELGTGGTVAHWTPIPVHAYATATAIAVRRGRTCAIVGPRLLCAGDARAGAFGFLVRPESDGFEPLRDSNGREIVATAVAATAQDSCVRLPDRRWTCTGIERGQTRVTLLPAFEGRTTIERVLPPCRLESDGVLTCHGAPGRTGVVMARGGHAPCSLDERGELVCWLWGEDETRRSVPVVRDARPVDFVVANEGVCTLAGDGRVACTRANGTETTPAVFRGVPVAALAGALGTPVCGLARDGRILCGASPRPTPLPTVGSRDPRLVDLELTRHGYCTLDAARTLVCAFDGRTASLPDVASFALGERHVCALRTDGRVATFGSVADQYATGPARFLLTAPAPVPLDP